MSSVVSLISSETAPTFVARSPLQRIGVLELKRLCPELFRVHRDPVVSNDAGFPILGKQMSFGQLLTTFRGRVRFLGIQGTAELLQQRTTEGWFGYAHISSQGLLGRYGSPHPFPECPDSRLLPTLPDFVYALLVYQEIVGTSLIEEDTRGKRYACYPISDSIPLVRLNTRTGNIVVKFHPRKPHGQLFPYFPVTRLFS